jgi:hypothetical protein
LISTLANFAERSREDWDIIEAALGLRDIDPQRRKALCRRLQITVKL